MSENKRKSVVFCLFVICLGVMFCAFQLCKQSRSGESANGNIKAIEVEQLESAERIEAGKDTTRKVIESLERVEGTIEAGESRSEEAGSAMDRARKVLEENECIFRKLLKGTETETQGTETPTQRTSANYLRVAGG